MVILALALPRRNWGSRAQTSIFTIENLHFLVQIAPEASWPPDVSAESLEARSPQPGVLSQASSARIPQSGVLSKIPQPGVLSQESSARIPQPGVLGQESSAKIPQPGFLSQESPANLFGVRAGVIFCESHVIYLKLDAVARTWLMLILDEAMCIRVVSETLLTPQRPTDVSKILKEFPCGKSTWS